MLAACAAPPRPPAPAAAPEGWAFPQLEVTAARRAMVTSDAPLASEVGVAILRKGGNAIDAAVATAFALAVVYPEAGNLGGGGFLVARLPDGTTAALDFRERAPLAASRDMFLDQHGELTDRSVTGHLAAGVPGAVAGLHAAHQRYGRLPWAKLLAPAIRLAEQGFTVSPALARSVADAAPRLAAFPASAALLLPGGRPLVAGTTWRNPDLAAVLRRIAERGPAGFYEGETADLIVAEMERGGGLITHEDLKRYRAEWREPVSFDYRGHRVISMPPASSGGITLALIANQLEAWDLGALGRHSPATLHLTAEAMRRAFADRNHFLGDPDFVDVPRARLLSQPYADSLAASINVVRATASAAIRPGLAAAPPTGAPGSMPLPESDHTTHLSVVDPAGGAVALTTTINELYGSAVTVTGAGFLLNNEMDDFAARPGSPNTFGLVQGEANAIAPGKRMLSAMTPTIVLDRRGEPLIVTGARGGPRIITAVFQVISGIIDHNLGLGDAVRLPRIHHQHLPDVLYFEPRGLPEPTLDSLRNRGHDVRERDSFIGTAPTLLRRNGRWYGVADPRTGGAALGF